MHAVSSDLCEDTMVCVRYYTYIFYSGAQTAIAKPSTRRDVDRTLIASNLFAVSSPEASRTHDHTR